MPANGRWNLTQHLKGQIVNDNFVNVSSLISNQFDPSKIKLLFQFP